jgi:hypothetical protein
MKQCCVRRRDSVGEAVGSQMHEVDDGDWKPFHGSTLHLIHI